MLTLTLQLDSLAYNKQQAEHSQKLEKKKIICSFLTNPNSKDPCEVMVNFSNILKSGSMSNLFVRWKVCFLTEQKLKECTLSTLAALQPNAGHSGGEGGKRYTSR